MSKSNGDERPHCVLRRNVMIETYTTEVIEPCNIMYDPRVYRGSVIAHRRNEILRIKRELDEKKQRERAQAKMLRQRTHAKMKMKKAAKEDTLNMDGLKRSKVTRLKSIRNRDFTYDIDVTGEKDANRSESELTYESLASQLARLEYPHMHSSYKVTLKSHPKRMSTLMKGKRKVHFITDSAWDIRGESFENEPKSPLLMTTNAVHLTTTPSPDSQSTTTEFGDAFVQTSVDYDESVKLMVDELVECSIYVAQKTLDEEERQNANRTQMEKLQSELERKDEINSELREKLETSKKQIEETRKENEKVLNTRIADVLVEDLVEEATRRMDEGQLRAISDQRSLCDSAVDTRDFIRQELRNKVVLSELEKDFFPWLYGKVKNMVDHCFAASYLDDAFLCEEAEIKQNSKTALIGKLREV